MFSKNVRIFGRAIPLWLIVSLMFAVIAAAAFLVFLQRGIFTTVLAEAPGPVLIGGPDERGCYILHGPGTGDPEDFGTTCALVAVDGEVDHSALVDGVYPGVFITVRIPVENHDPVNVLYGQVVDQSEIPPGVIFSNGYVDNDFCGLALGPGATGGYDYRLEFDGAYDGSAFEIPFLWGLDNPGEVYQGCPTY